MNATLLISGTVLLFAVLSILPMIPMLQTIRKKEDTQPLVMDMEFIFNPRYHAESFEKSKTQEERYTTIHIKEHLDPEMLPEKSNKSIVFRSSDSVTVQGKMDGVLLDALGNINVKEQSRLYALKSEQKITVGTDAVIDGWIDSQEMVEVGENTQVNVVSAKSIRLHPGARFKRLYADTIGIFPLNGKEEDKSGRDTVHKKLDQNVENGIVYLDDNDAIGAGSTIDKDVICRGDLTIEEKCQIYGSVKCNGTLTIADDVFIYGNVFADESITIKNDCYVFGNLFSHTYIKIGKNGQFGRYGKAKSIIGIKGVEIASGTFIHNYVLTYGEGKIV